MKQDSFIIKKVIETLKFVLIFLVMALAFQYILMSVTVDGKSMEPNYQNGERAIMLKVNPLNKVKRYNVIVVKRHIENTNTDRIVKRVYGLPNETVEIRDNKIYIDGKEIEDKYKSSDSRMNDFSPRLLAEDEYFVLGDNRMHSSDSRDFRIDLIRDYEIEAVHGLVYWPLGQFGLMK